MQNNPFGPLGEGRAAQQHTWATAPPQNDARFNHRSYLIRRKFAKLVGGAYHVDDPSGNVVLYANQKGFKLKEDIRLYTGEDMTRELIVIQARSVLDFSATYDVTDTASGQRIGSLRRKGMQSLVQDEWLILDAQEREMGVIKEDNIALALLRRFIGIVSLFLPQSYNCTIGDRVVATYSQTKNPFLIKIAADFSADTTNLLDRRLGICAAILLAAVEGKQKSEF